MIDHERKLIFLHIARTGGTSVETALVKKDWWFVDPETKHLSAQQARAHYGDIIWNNYTKFSIVRNPWDRLVSMWATKWWHESSGLPVNIPFEEFIRRVKPHPHEIYNTLFYHEILNLKLDFILRFENLESDFNKMLKKLNLKQIELPHTESRERPYYPSMYSVSAKNYVQDYLKEDIRKFKYSF